MKQTKGRTEYDREYHSRPEIKARRKAERADPEWSARQAAYMKLYAQRPGVKEQRKIERARPESREKQRIINLKRKFGLTVEQWEALFARQGKRCAVCRVGHPRTKKRWHTDHCHETGVVRGILCHGCNTALGHVRDEIHTLQGLIVYLQEHKCG